MCQWIGADQCNELGWLEFVCRRPEAVSHAVLSWVDSDLLLPASLLKCFSQTSRSDLHLKDGNVALFLSIYQPSTRRVLSNVHLNVRSCLHSGH